MSRAIKLDTDDIASALEQFKQALESAKLADGKFSFTTTIGKSDDKASVVFSPIAWLKMQALIAGFSSEVGWYCTARRSEDEDDDTYFIDDILVYPQSVTGAYVDFDESEVSEWIFANRDDERIFNIRAHGHSHVNMAVNPSSTDKAHYKKILEGLTPEGFFIFMIWNKSGQSYCEIYDMKKNILFEDGDISMAIEGVENLGEFMANARSNVKTKTYTQGKGAPNAWEAKKAATEDDKKKPVVKSSTQKRSDKKEEKGYYGNYSWDDYEDGYWGGSYGLGGYYGSK